MISKVFTRSARRTLHSARAMANSNRREDAIAMLEAALLDYPDHAPLYLLLGTIFDQIVNIRELKGTAIPADSPLRAQAVAHLCRASDLTPDSVHAAYLAGQALRHKGDHKKALDYFKRAVEVAPTHARAWTEMAVIMQSIKQPRAAVVCLQNALHSNPHDAIARKRLTRMGITARAGKALDRSVLALDIFS